MAAGSEEGRWKWIQERVKGIIEGKRYSRSRERCSIKEDGNYHTGRKYGERGSC